MANIPPPPWQAQGREYPDFKKKSFAQRLQEEGMATAPSPNPQQRMSESSLSCNLMKYSRNWSTLQPASVETHGVACSGRVGRPIDGSAFVDGRTQSSHFYGVSDNCLYSVQNLSPTCSFVQLCFHRSTRNETATKNIWHGWPFPFKINAVAVDSVGGRIGLLSISPKGLVTFFTLRTDVLEYFSMFPNWTPTADNPRMIPPTLEDLKSHHLFETSSAYKIGWRDNVVISQFELFGKYLGVALSDDSIPAVPNEEERVPRILILDFKTPFLYQPIPNKNYRCATFQYIGGDRIVLFYILCHQVSVGMQPYQYTPLFRAFQLYGRKDYAYQESKDIQVGLIQTLMDRNDLHPAWGWQQATIRRVSFVRNTSIPDRDPLGGMDRYVTEDMAPLPTNGPYLPDPQYHLLGIKIEIPNQADAVFIAPLEAFHNHLLQQLSDPNLGDIIQMPPSVDFALNGQKAIWREVVTNGLHGPIVASLIKCRNFVDEASRRDTLGTFASPSLAGWVTTTRGNQVVNRGFSARRMAVKGTLAISSANPNTLRRMVVCQDYIMLFYPSTVFPAIASSREEYEMAVSVLSF